MRRDLIDKCNVSELLEAKSKIYTQLEVKVELKEVQNALNECQNEIVEQLSDYKKTIKNDLHQTESDIFKIIERKANVLDVQEALSLKADQRDVIALPQKSEVQDYQYRVERMQEEINSKLD